MTFAQAKKKMRDFNTKHKVSRKVDEKKTKDGRMIQMVAKVVVSNNALNREYPIEQRTYEFDNYNKALTSGDLGYSIFASCKSDGDVMRIEYFEDKDFDSVEIISIVE